MNTYHHWRARRVCPSSAQSPADDLGLYKHIEKVLAKTFSSAAPNANGMTWSKGPVQLALVIEQVARPTYVDFLLTLEDAEIDAAIDLLSPRLRRLAEDRFWQITDVTTSQPVALREAKRLPRRKQGVIDAALSVEELKLHLAMHRRRCTLLVGGLADVAALDRFLDNRPPRDLALGLDATFGWDNFTINTPDGTRFYALDFGGSAAHLIREWYASRARASSLMLAFADEDALILQHQDEKRSVSIAECQGTLRVYQQPPGAKASVA